MLAPKETKTIRRFTTSIEAELSSSFVSICLSCPVSQFLCINCVVAVYQIRHTMQDKGSNCAPTSTLAWAPPRTRSTVNAVQPRHCSVPQPHAGGQCTIQVQLHRRPSLPSDWDKRKPSQRHLLTVCSAPTRYMETFFFSFPSTSSCSQQFFAPLLSPLFILLVAIATPIDSESIIKQLARLCRC